MQDEQKKGGRPITVGASIKTTLLLDPERMDGLSALAEETQRSRNALIREAIDDLLAKHRQFNSGSERLKQLLKTARPRPTQEELKAALDKIAEMGKGRGYLPEEAFDRENLYEDRL